MADRKPMSDHENYRYLAMVLWQKHNGNELKLDDKRYSTVTTNSSRASAAKKEFRVEAHADAVHLVDEHLPFIVASCATLTEMKAVHYVVNSVDEAHHNTGAILDKEIEMTPTPDSGLICCT